jgi:hypothetical protein
MTTTTTTKVIREVPANLDPVFDRDTVSGLQALLDNGLRVGWDGDAGYGMVDVGRFGDIYFSFASNNDALYVGVNDKSMMVKFYPSEEGIKSILSLTSTFKSLAGNTL